MIFASADAAPGGRSQFQEQLTFIARVRSANVPSVVCGLSLGRAPERILAASGHLADFAWTKSGRTAALVRATGEPPVPSVNVTSAAGPGRRIAFGSQPAWSPDGLRIAYIANGALHVARSDGSRKRRLLRPRGMASWAAPRWSDDGRRIYVFDAWSGPVRWWLHSVRADGTGLRQIRTSWPLYADWSPDRRQIAYAYAGDLYVANADGRGARLIAAKGRRPVNEIAWHPDGRTLVFVRRSWDRKATGDLFTIDRDGTGETQLTRTSYDESAPSWRLSPMSAPTFGACVPPGA